MVSTAHGLHNGRDGHGIIVQEAKEVQRGHLELGHELGDGHELHVRAAEVCPLVRRPDPHLQFALTCSLAHSLALSHSSGSTRPDTSTLVSPSGAQAR